MLEYQNINSFFAQGTYHFGQQNVKVQLTGTYKSHTFDPVKIMVWSEDEKAPELFDSSMRYPYFVWFEGVTELGLPIWMMEIKPYQITDNKRLEGEVSTYVEGDYDVIIKPEEEINIQAKIAPNPLIVPDWLYSVSYDGTISRMGEEKERIGINWENQHGKSKLIDTYEYVNLNIDNQDITIRLRINSLYLSIIPHTETNLKTIFNQLTNYLKDDFILLSFIGRRRIDCYEANARVNHEGKSLVGFSRYKSWRGFNTLSSTQHILRLLLIPKELKDGLFNHLLVNYYKSPYKGLIERSIQYLLSSYEDGYIETHLLNAFAALENLVDGIGVQNEYSYLLGSNDFKKLSKNIRTLIRNEVQDKKISDGIIKKIPELRRRSFVDRLLFLLSKQEVDTSLIWPPNIDQAFEFHELIKRRNLLIHKGEIYHTNISYFDLNRVQKLVELWILKLLDCPPDAINKYSLWHDAPINKLLRY